MSFESENTYGRMVAAGDEDLFHTKFDRAMEARLTSEKLSYPCYVGGRQIRMTEEFEARSPIDSSIVVGSFQRGDSELARTAVRKANEAYQTWSSMSWEERMPIFTDLANRMRRMRFPLAVSLTLSNGKNRFEAMAEVDEAIDMISYYTSQMDENWSRPTPMMSVENDERTESVMRPYGCWTIIPPFNFPLAIATGMLIGALVTGNVAVLKPPSAAPLPSYMLYDIMERSGFPDGVVNVITGLGRTVGDALVRDPGTAGIAFTGSLEVGRGIMKAGGERGIPVIAEMGGKNAIIVGSSADLDQAASAITSSAFGYSGQKCSACSLVYVHRNVARQLEHLVIERVSDLIVGDPVEGETFMGPIISATKAEQFISAVSEAKSTGNLLCGGEEIKVPGLDGNYPGPTVISGLPDDSRLLSEELFMPLLCLLEFEDLEDALNRINNGSFGLTGGIFSQDQEEIDRYTKAVKAGVLYINRAKGITGALVGSQPFVGWKDSGYSGVGAGGPHYLGRFMQEQSRTYGGSGSR